MDLHVHFEIVFALKLCRAFIATKVLVVCMHKHVTSQLSLQIKTLWTVGTAKVPRYDVMMLLLMAFKIVQIIGRILALPAVEVANVLVIVDDVLVQGLTVGACELWTVRTAVDLLAMLGACVRLKFLLAVGLAGVLTFAVQQQLVMVGGSVAAGVTSEGLGAPRSVRFLPRMNS
jgi:hypothetical protein